MSLSMVTCLIGTTNDFLIIFSPTCWFLFVSPMFILVRNQKNKTVPSPTIIPSWIVDLVLSKCIFHLVDLSLISISTDPSTSIMAIQPINLTNVHVSFSSHAPIQHHLVVVVFIFYFLIWFIMWFIDDGNGIFIHNYSYYFIHFNGGNIFQFRSQTPIDYLNIGLQQYVF